MNRSRISVVVLSLIGFIIVGVFIFSTTNFLRNKSRVEQSSKETENVTELTGQLYEKTLYRSDRSTTSVPLLHISKPLPVSEQYSQYTEVPIQYIELVVPTSNEWKGLVGSLVRVTGVVETGLKENENHATVAIFKVTDLKKDSDSSAMDPILDGNNIVGKIGVAECAQSTITFYLPNNVAAVIYESSDAAYDGPRIKTSMWSQNTVASETSFPYTLNYNQTNGLAWSDGTNAPGFFTECGVTTYSSVFMLWDDPRLMYMLGKYIPTFDKDIQEEIYKLHPILKTL
jgi:hypothetical protein